jgi:hypothetical protein
MTIRRAIGFAALAVTCVAAQNAPRPDPEAEAAATIKGADDDLVRSVRAVADRVAAIVGRPRDPRITAVRADESTREAEVAARAQKLLPPANAAARGRAWRDIGFGSGTEPGELVAAIERDLPGMTFDAARSRLLVDPNRLLSGAGHGNPDEEPDASILLTTGVAPDETVAGHYVAHALLDGPTLDGPVTTDALLARSALAEGSANLTALVLLFGGVGLEQEVVSGALRPEDALGGRLVPETMRSAGPVVASLLEFVYLDGFAQSAALARKAGFNRLAQDRKSRRTTRDVLHLERAPAPQPELPEPALPGTLALSRVDQDSLGEQGVVSLVSLLTGKDNLGLIAGDGWVGDALWRFEPTPGSKADGGDGATIWVTRWNSEGDAGDFSYALERCLQARFPGEALEADPVRGGRTLRRADRTYRIEKNGVQVILRVASAAIDAKMGSDPKKKRPQPQRPPTKSKGKIRIH